MLTLLIVNIINYFFSIIIQVTTAATGQMFIFNSVWRWKLEQLLCYQRIIF